MSDWGVKNAEDGDAAKAGLDMAMDIGDTVWNGGLEKAVLSGSVTEARLDDMVHR